jgi:hypothetical protein
MSPKRRIDLLEPSDGEGTGVTNLSSGLEGGKSSTLGGLVLDRGKRVSLRPKGSTVYG